MRKLRSTNNGSYYITCSQRRKQTGTSLSLVLSKPFICLLVSGFFSIILGLIFGVILVTTGPGKIYENKIVHQTLSAFTNVFRSIPFVILIAVLTGLTRVISGTIIGAEGVIFPLIVACTPFFIRQVDLSLSEVDGGLIEAAQSMGLSRLQIIWKVYLRESIPSIFRSISITLISLLGLSHRGRRRWWWTCIVCNSVWTWTFNGRCHMGWRYCYPCDCLHYPNCL
ncbi:ABC transporter permease [Erysipelothrix sp. D19-032]